jgi:DNA-binding NtrC family response regulator
MEPKHEPSHRIRVLVVDDDPRALAGLEGVLAAEHDVVACTSARRALEIARTEAAAGRPFDVVCSDFRMPEMDGGELLLRMSDLAEPPASILITGHVEVLTGEHSGAAHILGIVVKPYDPEHIISLVGRLGRVTRMNRSSIRRLNAHGGRQP